MRNINIWNGTPLGYNKEYDDVNLGLPRLDEFAINDGKKHPCILIIPGGGYDHLSDHEGENVAIELNKLGISAFVLYYRIAPYRHPIYLYGTPPATISLFSTTYRLTPFTRPTFTLLLH